MKKTLLTLMLLIASVAANAQNFYGGGSIGIQSVHSSNDVVSATTTAFQISPEVGYNFNKTWAVGLCFSYNFSHLDDYDVSAVNFYPYVRATFAHVAMFDFFAELGMGYGHQSAESYGADGFVSVLRPGFLAHINDRFALIGRTSLLSFDHYDGTSTVGFGLNSNYTLGVQFTF